MFTVAYGQGPPLTVNLTVKYPFCWRFPQGKFKGGFNPYRYFEDFPKYFLTEQHNFLQLLPKSATQLAAQFANKDAVLLLLEHGFVDISLNLLDWRGVGGGLSPCRFLLVSKNEFSGYYC